MEIATLNLALQIGPQNQSASLVKTPPSSLKKKKMHNFMPQKKNVRCDKNIN